MAGTPPNDPRTPWGNVPPPSYFQQPPGGAPGPNPYGFNYGPRVDFDVIGRAWTMIMSDNGTWVLATLLVVIIAYGVSATFMVPIFMDMFQQLSKTIAQNQANPSSIEPFQFQTGYSAFLLVGMGVFINALVTLLNVGLSEMSVRRLEGRPISISDVFIGFRHFGSVFGVGLVSALIAGSGTILFALPPLFSSDLTTRLVCTLCTYAWIIPQYIIYGLLCFAPLLIVRGRARGLQAIGMSYRILKPQMWVMALLYFCVVLLSGLGAVACCVGLLWTYAIFPISIGLTYANFFPPTADSARQEGPSNYYRS